MGLFSFNFNLPLILHLDSDMDKFNRQGPNVQHPLPLQADANTVVIFRPTIYELTCRTEQETMILSAALLEHMDSLFLTGNEIGDLDPWNSEVLVIQTMISD